MEITRESLLTFGIAAAATGIFVQLIKMWLAPKVAEQWHDPAIHTLATAIGFGTAVLAYYANRLPIDGPTIAYLFLYGAFVGLAATGGYEVVSNLIAFVGGQRPDGQA